MKGPDYSGFEAFIFRVKPGEGVGEKILSFVQDRENFPAYLRDKNCLGVLVSAIGNVLNPEVEVQESSMSVDGVYEIQDLKGFYEIPKDGNVRISGGLRVSFSGPECFLGGPVVGPLVAATPIQVVVLIAEVGETTYVF